MTVECEEEANEEPVEQSAFDVDMEDENEVKTVDPAKYNVTRTFSDDNEVVINKDMLRSARV